MYFHQFSDQRITRSRVRRCIPNRYERFNFLHSAEILKSLDDFLHFIIIVYINYLFICHGCVVHYATPISEIPAAQCVDNGLQRSTRFRVSFYVNRRDVST